MSFELILSFLRPIELLVLDKSVGEIMGNPDASWFTERNGILCQEPNISFDAGRLRTGLEVIANQLGKTLDEDNLLRDAHLPDASRLAAAIPPVVCPSRSLTIRKFTSRHYTINDLIARGTLTRPLADFLAEAEIGEAVDFVVHVERQPSRRILREILALHGYDRDAKRFLIEPVFEVKHGTP